MPCGMPIDDLIAKMKAKGVPGSIEAEKVFEQLYRNQQILEIDISKFPTGVYLFRINQEEKINYQKLLIR